MLNAPLTPRANAGPRVLTLECLFEVVYVVEILDPVVQMADEEPDVDKDENNAAKIIGRPDAPMLEYGSRGEAVLLEREVAASFRQLRTGDVAAHLPHPLTVLERSQHEQVSSLVIPSIQRPDACEHFLGELNLEHDR